MVFVCFVPSSHIHHLSPLFKDIQSKMQSSGAGRRVRRESATSTLMGYLSLCRLHHHSFIDAFNPCGQVVSSRGCSPLEAICFKSCLAELSRQSLGDDELFAGASATCGCASLYRLLECCLRTSDMCRQFILTSVGQLLAFHAEGTIKNRGAGSVIVRPGLV